VESKRTPFTSTLDKDQVIMVPVGHGEGRLLLQSQGMLEELIDDKQVVFRYALEDGSPAGGKYPENPNGAIFDVAGICNKKGNVMGMMPHPERAFYGWQLPSWGVAPPEFGDGRASIRGRHKLHKEDVSTATAPCPTLYTLRGSKQNGIGRSDAVDLLILRVQVAGEVLRLDALAGDYSEQV